MLYVDGSTNADGSNSHNNPSPTSVAAAATSSSLFPTAATAILPTNNKPSTHHHYSSMNSDSSYTAVSRFTRRPFSKGAATHITLDTTFMVDGDGDDNWAADTLSDDEVETSRPEAIVAPLLEEGEMDQDAIVVSPTGNSALAANNGTWFVICLYMLLTSNNV